MGERLTVAEAAKRASVSPSTWRSYVAREQAPKPDGEFDKRTPWWWDSTVESWVAGRPGRGRRRA